MKLSKYGEGIYSKGKYLSKQKGIKKATKEYETWSKMLQRCYCEGYQKRQPTYKGCTVSKNFKNFQYFAEWCNNQVGFGNEGWELDKDVLVRGNKIYSESTCVFIPKEINSIVKSTNKRVDDKDNILPLGVYFYKRDQNYVAKICKEGKVTHLGYFNTIAEAFAVYKKEREVYFKKKAVQFKDFLDKRVYIYLINYEINSYD